VTLREVTDPAARMLRSWQRNATAWTGAVRERRIASRRAGTDAAIVAAVLAAQPQSVLDVGCGEGWFARELSMSGCRVVGIDASEALIDSARSLGGGRFEAMAYADVADRAAQLGAPFDIAVCNFSLLEEDLVPVLSALRDGIAAHGRLLIQTVHPWIANRDGPYVDGWRTETFADFGADFVEPMPWYFRTLSSWIEIVGSAGLRIARVDEPIDADSGRPLSLLIHATRVDESEPR
jgi:2-polyprenyl-3-methyl-5-hydroxy-6-metoxy-1,4-benzoquinol methylase